jgi:hypothetical protein
MKVDQLISYQLSPEVTGTIKDFEELGIIESLEFPKSTKVDVIGRVDSLRNTIDRMRNRETPSQRRSIFHIIDPEIRLARILGNAVYSKELVCNISTTWVMISKATSGTCSHKLKLVII